MNDNLDNILQKLKKEEPILDNPKQMTEMIMASLPDKVNGHGTITFKEKKSPSIIRAFLRTASYAAAITAACIICTTAIYEKKESEKKDYEQCIAKYTTDYSSISSKNPNEAFNDYLKIRRSQNSIINKLKEAYYEKN